MVEVGILMQLLQSIDKDLDLMDKIEFFFYFFLIIFIISICFVDLETYTPTVFG